MFRAAASLGLAVALAGSLADGRWRVPPDRAKRVAAERPVSRPKPSVVSRHQPVTASALRRGCAAWGEDLATCTAPEGVAASSGDVWPEVFARR